MSEWKNIMNQYKITNLSDYGQQFNQVIKLSEATKKVVKASLGSSLNALQYINFESISKDIVNQTLSSAVEMNESVYSSIGLSIQAIEPVRNLSLPLKTAIEAHKLSSSTIESPAIKNIEISQAIKSILEFNKTMEPFVQRSKEIFSKAEPTLSAVGKVFDNIDFDALRKYVEKSEDDFSRLKLFMIEIGLPLHPDYFFANPTRIMTIYDEKGPAYAKRFLVRFMRFVFNTTLLNDMKKRWLNSSWLGKRTYILAQSIDAHNQKLYAPAITAMFTQIEGILSDHILETTPNKKGITTKDQKEHLKYKLFDTSDSAYDIDQVINNLFENIIYANFKLGQPLNSDLSRHAILHGYDVEFSNKTNSLRLIIIIDIIIRKIESQNNI